VSWSYRKTARQHAHHQAVERNPTIATKFAEGLLDAVLGQKRRAGIEEVVSSPSRTPRLASVRRD